MVYKTQSYWVFGIFPSSSGEGGRRYLLRWTPKKELISITGQLLPDLQSYLITRDKANSAGDNKKVYNKSCDKACIYVELG
jgi:hypothetical protein